MSVKPEQQQQQQQHQQHQQGQQKPESKATKLDTDKSEGHEVEDDTTLSQQLLWSLLQRATAASKQPDKPENVHVTRPIPAVINGGGIALTSQSPLHWKATLNGSLRFAGLAMKPFSKDSRIT